MARGIWFGAAILLCGAVAVFASAQNSKREPISAQNPAATVVRIRKTQHGIAYEVNSRSTGHTAATDILRALNEVSAGRGSNAPVVVLVDSRASFTDIWNFEGIAGKAQLNNIHFFVVNHETDRMAELKWGPTIPYSANPTAN